mmetsp:Transcript_5723/g.14887  ORF Transcript_5723/g.14887 Transcript_5723/m.14887 type:complete len:240 (-) Transcript_5723:1290-2009(-)
MPWSAGEAAWRSATTLCGQCRPGAKEARGTETWETSRHQDHGGQGLSGQIDRQERHKRHEGGRTTAQRTRASTPGSWPSAASITSAICRSPGYALGPTAASSWPSRPPCSWCCGPGSTLEHACASSSLPAWLPWLPNAWSARARMGLAWLLLPSASYRRARSCPWSTTRQRLWWSPTWDADDVSDASIPGPAIRACLWPAGGSPTSACRSPRGPQARRWAACAGCQVCSTWASRSHQLQ